ncbi:acyl-CoA oxidase [Macrolepiota fuliginosa MF-IS2]|uniref:Acyl-coenzyme A oxidase n=1 Tax=Macrolepiota fuliginosa MF-IS2 TaxID=1400762 RepID=A0A9P5XIW7_9AGAR|nr:acyl-CoA oxidase [Macrolepiota fuliginosa MF-IS2]
MQITTMPPPLDRQVQLMRKARAKTSFDPRQLTYVIFGGKDEVQRREGILARVERTIGEGGRKLPRNYGEMNRTDLYHHGLHVGRAMQEDEIIHRHGLFSHMDVNYALLNASPFGLHDGMFIPTLKLQGDPEQRAHWLPLAESGAIIGTYCQTELGHGTFLRRLETTAHFDLETDEFIIHSPTPSSTKYWPGGLGYSCSHAIVMARLVIREKDYGIHAFIVQLRSLDDWKPLSGIELGDIGLTMGLNGTDNGYAVFDHARVPRRNMMMGYARVARDGTYTPPSKEHTKHSYGTMVQSRALISNAVAFQLAQATTIAIRYSTVREQGNISFDTANSTDMPIISFRSQHYRLLSLLARAYAILFASKSCLLLYDSLGSEQKGGNSPILPYLHITTAALKAYGSQVAADGAEDARKCCGGHGYSALSGLPDIVANITSIPTLEGENYVMYQQTARYLVKQAQLIRTGRSDKTDKNVGYLVTGYEGLSTRRDVLCPYSQDELLNCNSLLRVFRHRAARSIFECAAALELAQKNGHTTEKAWNQHMMQLIMAARYHAECFVLDAFIQHVSEIEDQKVQRVMEHACRLYALTTIESPFSIGSSGFFEDGYISLGQLNDIRQHVNTTLEVLLPEAIGLSDAWNFSDVSLRSALGRRDGNVYETLLDWTRQLPINKRSRAKNGVDQVGFERYIRPMMKIRSNL